MSKFCKLDTYRKIKSDYRKEPYILYVHIKRHQQTLTTQIAKFMAPTWGPPGSCRPMNLSIREGYELVLIISTLSAGGRHCRTITPRNERLCNFCSLDQVEDEKHFLMACNFHSTERQSLLEVIIPILKLDRESDTTELFLLIMGSRETTVLQALANSSMVDFKSEINRKHLVTIETISTPRMYKSTFTLNLFVSRNFKKKKLWSINLILF